MTRVCVVGLGYIGLPTACLLATHGCSVLGVDTDPEVISAVGQGRLHFAEPALDELLKEAISHHSLAVSLTPEPADVFVIAVPTPLDKQKLAADLEHVINAAGSIAAVLERETLVILESTVPPGTCEDVLIPTLGSSGLQPGRDFYLAHCPERAIPGATLREMVYNDRVIGVVERRSADAARQLYSSFVKGDLHFTDLRTAEMVKLMENTYRDINIAMANEFAKIAERIGVTIWDAIELANKHPRVNILSPGPGVGGHCLAIDPWFLAGNPSHSRIISLAREINDSMPGHVLDMVKDLVPPGGGAVITVLGIAYKRDIDDTRESPALAFIALAQSAGYHVRSFDPWVERAKCSHQSVEEAACASDCLVVITDHTLFGEMDPVRIAQLMRNRNIIDTRNTVDREKWETAGFKLSIIGDGRRFLHNS